jgi:predicted phosphodiesterase
VDLVAPRNTPLKRILLVGDSHGNAPWLGEVLARARGLDIDTVVQLGDFGIWSGKKGQLLLDAVAAHASDAGVTMYALGGNHDDSAQISAFEQHRDDDGFVTLRQGLRWIPRGHRWSWEGVRFGAVGGAFSIDHRRRIPGISWWPDEEEVKPEDVETLGAEPLDVLLTHDAPEGASPESMFQLDPHDMAQARKSRLLLRAALEATRPRLLIHGHWHVRQTRLLKLYSGTVVRVEGLTYDLEGDGSAWAVLDLPNLEFRDGMSFGHG